MTPERWQQIDSLLEIALELEPSQWTAFLDRECEEDEELRREVESLLAAHRQADSFIEEPLAQVATDILGEDQRESLAGRQVGRYKVFELLGAGGMGEVYAAWDNKLGRKVALKLLNTQLTQDKERLRRFEQEAHAASALNHPNILTIHEIEQVDGRPCIVTEFIDGVTLREHMACEQIEANEKLDIAIQLASALSAAHEAGIVHRDIKPENIMRRQDGYIKVLDFGIAKLIEGPTKEVVVDRGAYTAADVKMATGVVMGTAIKTATGVVMGTTTYMSPEQAKGERVNTRSDIFSFGAVLYELLTGEMAFQHDSVIDTLHAVIYDEPAGIEALSLRVPAGVELVLRRCLEKEAERRYADGVELTAALEQVVESSRSTTGAPARAQRLWPRLQTRWWIALAGVALILLSGALWLGLSRFSAGHASKPAARTEAAAMKTVPLTALSGVVLYPHFSPDGNQVAFAWLGEADASEHNQDIYVKPINGATMLRLTSDPGLDSSPVWSPDGHWIAFLRVSDTAGAIYMIPATGGSERKLVSGHVFAGLAGFSDIIDWSADGTIVYSAAAAPGRPNELYRLSVETLESTQITSHPEHSGGDSHPASSPDGKLLAFVRRPIDYDSDLYLMPASGGEPTRLTFDNTQIIGTAWTADGRSIVFASKRGGTMSLWRISASGGEPERVGVGGDKAIMPAISRKGQRLAYVNGAPGTSSIWRLDLVASSGKASSRTRLLSTSTEDADPHLSPDGKKIVFTSLRSGDTEIWTCESDGSNPLQLTKLNSSDSPYWSPDGRWIAFNTSVNKQFDIYVISANGGVPRRLTEDPSSDQEPSWSRDGRWIYFESNRSGDRQVWKMNAEGGEAVQVTRHGGIRALESFDGRYIYYAKGYFVPGLWRVPVEGGEEELVLDRLHAGFWQLWAVAEKGIYFIEPEGKSGAVVEFYNTSTKQVTRVTALEKMPTRFSLLSVTPDGRWMLLAQADWGWAGGEFLSSDLMMVENFR